MSIRERQLKNGTMVYDVRVFMGYTSDGKQDKRHITCKTKRAAKLAEAQMVAERDAMRGRSGKMTLSQYIDHRYWPAALTRLAPSSLDTYEKEIRLRIRPELGNIDLRDIDRPKVQRMLDRIATDSVARKCLGTLKAILNEAKGDGLILANPATANYSMPQKGQQRDNGLVLASFDQIAAMLDIVRSKGSNCLQRIAYTGLLLGLRPEERYALDWEDFDLEGNAVSITSAVTSASARHGGNAPKATKTPRSARTVPLHPDFAEWIEGQPRTPGAFIKGADGARISPSTAQKRWARFLADNPTCPQVTIENMRHSFATSYLAAGGKIEALSRILGHSNINTTINRYYRPDISTLQDDLARISANSRTMD